jgi:hypothetical protein
MKRISKLWLLVPTVVVALTITQFIRILMVLSRGLDTARVRVAQFDRCDHAALLAACREMILERQWLLSGRTNDPSSGLLLDEVWLGQGGIPIPEAVPKVIRDLRPTYIVIRKDYLIIGAPVSPVRIGVVAYAKGVEPSFGTRKYIDGLWFWDGKDTIGTNTSNAGNSTR